MSWLRWTIYSGLYFAAYGLVEAFAGRGHSISMLLGALLALLLLVIDTVFPEPQQPDHPPQGIQRRHPSREDARRNSKKER